VSGSICDSSHHFSLLSSRSYLSACTSRDDKRNLNLTTCAASLVDAALAQYSREKEGLDADQANVRARDGKE